MVELAAIEVNLWMFLLLFFVVGPALGWGWRGGRAARRWIGADDELPAAGRRTVRQLEQELQRGMEVIEVLESRVAELENRLDFAERLLSAGGRPEAGPGSRSLGSSPRP